MNDRFNTAALTVLVVVNLLMTCALLDRMSALCQ